MDFIIKARYVLTGDEENPIIENGVVAVTGDSITYVGQREEEARQLVGAGAEVLTEPLGLLMPGMVNTHTHCAMTLFRGYGDDLPLMQWLQEKIWPAEADLTRDDVYWGTLAGIAEMLRAGVTTFADMYFEMEAVAEAVQETGIRASLARGLIGLNEGAAGALQEASQFAEDWMGKADGRITTMIAPHAPYTCPPEYLRDCIREAECISCPIHIHLCETLDNVDFAQEKFGTTPVQHLENVGVFARPVLAAHCVHLTDHDIELLAKYQVGVAHNPGSNLKLASGIAPVPKLLEAGATVGLGTDGASSNNNLDMLEETRLAALIHKVDLMDTTAVDAQTAFKMATVYGARALGLDNVGVIKAGFKADLVLMDLSGYHAVPLYDPYSYVVYTASSMDVTRVFVDGKSVYANGKVSGLDAGKIREEVSTRAKRLVAG